MLQYNRDKERLIIFMLKKMVEKWIQAAGLVKKTTLSRAEIDSSIVVGVWLTWETEPPLGSFATPDP